MRVVISEFMDEAAVAQPCRKTRNALRREASSIARTSSRPGPRRRRRAHRAQPHAGERRTARRGAARSGSSGGLGVGLDNIDVDACEARGIEVIPATGANALAVAEYVIATAMLLLRGAYASPAAVASGEWPRAALSSGRETGRQDARHRRLRRHRPAHGQAGRARWECDVIGFDAAMFPRPPACASGRAERPRSLDALLAEADVVTLHVPLVAATRNLIDAARLAR